MQETEAQKRERHHQEDLQRLRGFRPIDDTFMRGMFKDNIPLAELVLRIIVGKPSVFFSEKMAGQIRKWIKYKDRYQN